MYLDIRKCTTGTQRLYVYHLVLSLLSRLLLESFFFISCAKAASKCALCAFSHWLIILQTHSAVKTLVAHRDWWKGEVCHHFCWSGQRHPFISFLFLHCIHTRYSCKIFHQGGIHIVSIGRYTYKGTQMALSTDHNYCSSIIHLLTM